MLYLWFSVLLQAVFFLCGLATPSLPRWDDMHTKHSWKTIPSNWESLGPPPDDTMINLHVAFEPQNENALVDAIHEVSDPGHKRLYGAYLSKEQVAELVAPHPNTLKLVHSWLEHYHVPLASVSVTHGGSALTLTGVSVSQANALLGASYQLYRHVETNETILRTLGYALPAILHNLVQTVVPTTCFVSLPEHKWLTTRNLSSGSTAGLARAAPGDPVTVLSKRNGHAVTPWILRWLYKTDTYVPKATDKNKVGIAGFLRDYPSPTDLTAFMKKYRSDAVDATYNVIQVNGGRYNPGDPGHEANIDIQYSGAMAYPTPHTFYSVGRGPSGQEDRFFSWLDYALELKKIPQTISISYGVDEKNYPKGYALWACSLYLQLGSRGVSVLHPSGDDGVGKPEDCVDSSGNVQFIPFFPASCPWVTGVGGTTNLLPENGLEASGGGFSNYFKIPPYQKKDVSDYHNYLGSKYLGLYNVTGRGIPDVAAQAWYIPMIHKGTPVLVGGTSCSTPIFAGIISLLNDYLISQNKPPLGFLNPKLYGFLRPDLTDIKSGSNPGCGTPGFSAIVGWDPVTGLGTPNFESLLRILSSDTGPGSSTAS
ncbi:subtilisin-like protein [Lactarius quietus]|nr:subtilisin-like protein [Lactarius quietus]